MGCVERIMERLTSGPARMKAEFGSIYEGMRGEWPLTAEARLLELKGRHCLEISCVLHNRYRTNSYYRLYFFFDSVEELSERLQPFIEGTSTAPPETAASKLPGLARSLKGGTTIIQRMPVSHHPPGHNRYRTSAALTWDKGEFWVGFRTRHGNVQLPVELLEAIFRLLPTARKHCTRPDIS